MLIFNILIKLGIFHLELIPIDGKKELTPVALFDLVECSWLDFECLKTGSR